LGSILEWRCLRKHISFCTLRRAYARPFSLMMELWRPLMIIALFKCGTALRKDTSDQVLLANDRATSNSNVREVPQAAFNLVHRMAPRQCQLMYLAEFVNEYGKEWFDAALEKAYNQTSDATTSLIEEDDGINAEDWPACKPGSLVIDCARTLKPVMWLQQQWALADRLEMHQNAWYCPWCSTKDENFDTKGVSARKELYAGAVKAAGFNAEASESLCAQKVSKDYDDMQWRECMIVHASQLQLDSARQTELMELLTGWWSYKDKDKRNKMMDRGDYLEQLKWWAKEDLFGAKSGTAWTTKMLTSRWHMKSLGFDYNKEKKSCIPLVSQALETKILERIEREVSSVCDKDAGCSQKPGRYCPEGTQCDCQRPYTPQRALTTFNAVFWVVSPLTVATGATVVAYMTGGAAAVPLAVWNAGWFPDYIPAIIAMAATSRKWTPECMCFEKECKFDADLRRCALEASKDMRNSSNPYSWLPGNGLKCALTVGSEDACEFQSCSASDVQTRAGDGLFGRVGYEGADLYNCANLEGSLESELKFQSVLPDSEGASVENSAKARNEFYDRFELPPVRVSSSQYLGSS